MIAWWSDAITAARDLGVLASVGSAVAFWWDKYHARPRLVVRSVEELHFHRTAWTLVAEIENVGRANTSLLPVIELVAVGMIGERVRARLRLAEGQARTLEPHEPMRLEAAVESVSIGGEARTGDPSGDLDFSSYRLYRIEATRGASAVIRVPSWGAAPMGKLAFLDERLRAILKRKRFGRNLQKELDALQPDNPNE